MNELSFMDLTQIWESAHLSPNLMSQMQAVCEPLFVKRADPDKNVLAELPFRFCEHLNGDVASLRQVMMAWHILRLAARILDDFEDGDAALTQQRASLLNVSTSLIFTANLILSQLEVGGCVPDTAVHIRQTFNTILLQTCNGQHNDLLIDQPTLEERWQITTEKSGRFLGLIMWASARLATDNPETLDVYQEFGEIMGVMDQIHDDLRDLWATQHQVSDLTRSNRWSLPVAYAFSVLSPPECSELLGHLNRATASEEAEAEARRIISDSGAGLYLTVQLTRCYQRAQHLVQLMSLPNEQSEKLLAFLDKLRSFN